MELSTKQTELVNASSINVSWKNTLLFYVSSLLTILTTVGLIYNTYIGLSEPLQNLLSFAVVLLILLSIVGTFFIFLTLGVIANFAIYVVKSAWSSHPLTIKKIFGNQGITGLLKKQTLSQKFRDFWGYTISLSFLVALALSAYTATAVIYFLCCLVDHLCIWFVKSNLRDFLSSLTDEQVDMVMEETGKSEEFHNDIEKAKDELRQQLAKSSDFNLPNGKLSI